MMNRKQFIAWVLSVCMLATMLPVTAFAQAAKHPVLAGELALANGLKSAQIGSVTYHAADAQGAYALNASSARIRVKEGDQIAFKGTITAPEGETISWVRVDVYDANSAQPYTVGAEYFRASGLKAQQYDLANIPALTVGEAFGRKGYALAEGGQYIVMFSVGDSRGNGFADRDANAADDQGPAVVVDVKFSAATCTHPHSAYRYVQHSSGQARTVHYDNSMTHQVEPLYERYCGLCDTFLMDIWGAGTPEEHTLNENGVCTACAYDAAPAAFALAAEEIPSLAFTSPSDRSEFDVGELVTVKWAPNEATEEYVVHVKLLDGEPNPSSDNEAGATLDTQTNWKNTEYAMTVPANAAGKWIKFNVHGKTGETQTEAASSLYIYVPSNEPVDTRPPIVHSLQSTAGNRIARGEETTFFATLSDDIGFAEINMQIDGKSVKYVESADSDEKNKVISYTTAFQEAGEYSVFVFVTDHAGKNHYQGLGVDVVELEETGLPVVYPIASSAGSEIVVGTQTTISSKAKAPQVLASVEITIEHEVVERIDQAAGPNELIEISHTTSFDSAGSYYVEVIATDYDGNISKEVGFIGVVEKLQMSFPIVEITRDDYSPTAGETVTFTFYAYHDEGISSMEVFLDEKSIGRKTFTDDHAGEKIFTVTTPPLSEGEHDFNAVAYDVNGGYDNVWGTIRVGPADYAPIFGNPVFSHDFPVSANDVVEWTVDVEDDVQIKEIELYINGEHISTDTINDSAYTFWHSYSVKDWIVNGKTTFTLIAYDTAGNSSMKEFSVPVDNAPVIEPLQFNPGYNVTAGESVTVSTNVADDVQLARYELYMGGTKVDEGELSGTSASISYTASNLAVGTYEVKLVVYDTAGWDTELSGAQMLVVNGIDPTLCQHEGAPVEGTRITWKIDEAAGTHQRVDIETVHCYLCGLVFERESANVYAPEAHAYVVNMDRPVPGSGVWVWVNNESHKRVSIRYYEECECGKERESEAYLDETVAPHNLDEVFYLDEDKTTYDEYGHQLAGYQICKGCGEEIEVIRDPELHSYIQSRVCDVCGYIEKAIEFFVEIAFVSRNGNVGGYFNKDTRELTIPNTHDPVEFGIYDSYFDQWYDGTGYEIRFNRIAGSITCQDNKLIFSKDSGATAELLLVDSDEERVVDTVKIYVTRLERPGFGETIATDRVTYEQFEEHTQESNWFLGDKGVAITSQINLFDFEGQYTYDTEAFPEGCYQVSFDAYNGGPVAVGVSVYDAEGNKIGETQIINGYFDSFNVVNIGIQGASGIYEIITGNFGNMVSGESNVFNTKTEFELLVPDGGYIQFESSMTNQHVMNVNIANLLFQAHSAYKAGKGWVNAEENLTKIIDINALADSLYRNHLTDKVIEVIDSYLKSAAIATVLNGATIAKDVILELLNDPDVFKVLEECIDLSTVLGMGDSLAQIAINTIADNGLKANKVGYLMLKGTSALVEFADMGSLVMDLANAIQDTDTVLINQVVTPVS